MASPFLKWAGGKSQLLAQFEELYPAAGSVKRYIEPFVGAGAVFFDVRNRLQPRHVFLSDNNAELVNVWQCLQTDVEAVITELAKHRARHGHDYYYFVRALEATSLPLAARAARLIYLNRTCFNGLYRVNSKGRFNVPLGRYKNPRILDAQNLRDVAAAVQSATLRLAHFRETVQFAKSGDFIYFDPPYHPVSPTASFTSYTEGSFGPTDQQELAEVYAQLTKKGCLVMLSNSDTPFVRGLYRPLDVHIHHVNARRSINSRADKRGLVQEVVVLNYDKPRGRRVLGRHVAAARSPAPRAD